MSQSSSFLFNVKLMRGKLKAPPRLSMQVITMENRRERERERKRERERREKGWGARWEREEERVGRGGEDLNAHFSYYTEFSSGLLSLTVHFALRLRMSVVAG